MCRIPWLPTVLFVKIQNRAKLEHIVNVNPPKHKHSIFLGLTLFCVQTETETETETEFWLNLLDLLHWLPAL